MGNRRRAGVWIILILACLAWFSPAQGAEPRNVIFLIGDGMGPESVGLAIYYNRFMNGMEKRLNMERLMAAGNTGYCLTYQYGTVVTDSASAATALASGVKTRDAIIGKDHDGRPMKTIADIARQLGKSTGVISNTRMTHATPAAFYANIIHRDMENEIAAQLIERGDLNVAFSGGAQHFIPQQTNVEDHPDLKGIHPKAGRGKSSRKDSRDLLTEAKNKGYAIVANKMELTALNAGKAEKALGLFAGSGFPSAIDRQPRHETGVPMLSDMTEKALGILSKNPKGFFLMVEGGQVDWVAHGNDVASVVHEMLEFDETIGLVMSFAEANPDTLIVVTADHDTGGPAIAYSNYKPPSPLKLPSGETWKTKYNFAEKAIFEKMAAQKKSFLKMVLDSKGNPADLKREVEENSPFSLTEDQAAYVLGKDPQTKHPGTVFGDNTPQALMGRFFGKELNAGWAVGTHTHTPVMVFAKGPCGEKFRGLLDNIEIPRIMAESWGASLPAPK